MVNGLTTMKMVRASHWSPIQGGSGTSQTSTEQNFFHLKARAPPSSGVFVCGMMGRFGYCQVYITTTIHWIDLGDWQLLEGMLHIRTMNKTKDNFL